MLRFLIQLGVIVKALSSTTFDSSLVSFSQSSLSDVHTGIRSLLGLQQRNSQYKQGMHTLEYQPSGWLQVQLFSGVSDCSTISQQTTNTALGVCIVDGPSSSHMLIASGNDDGASLEQETYSDSTCTTFVSSSHVSSLPVTTVCKASGSNSQLTTYFAGKAPPSFPYSGAMVSLSADQSCGAVLTQTVVNSNYCFSSGYSSVAVTCDSSHPYVTHIYSDTFCTIPQQHSAVSHVPSTCSPYSSFVQSTTPQYTYGSGLRSCYNSTATSSSLRALRGI